MSYKNLKSRQEDNLEELLKVAKRLFLFSKDGKLIVFGLLFKAVLLCYYGIITIIL